MVFSPVAPLLAATNSTAPTQHVALEAASPLGSSKRRHYLKKILLTHLLQEELAALSCQDSLEMLGSPFKQTIGTIPITADNTRLPILRFVFHRFVCTFPFLSNTNQEAFWQDKVQVFFRLFNSKRISSSEDRAESSKRAKLAARIQSMLVLLMNAGIHAGKEESITIDEAEKRTTESVKNLEINVTDGQIINGFDVNVAGVRTVHRSHKVRRRQTHSEFLVKVGRQGKEDIYVARRYGAFKTLYARLKEEFPGKQIPRLPMKNKAPATATSYIPTMPSFGFSTSKEDAGEDSGESADEYSEPRTPQSDRRLSAGSTPQQVKIPREKQRLTLRSFLRSLLKDIQIARSTALRHFLLDNPTTLSQAEINDCADRKDLDAMRQDEQLKFLEAARERARELDAHMGLFKKQLIQENGLSKIFAAIRESEKIEDLPVQYIKVIEWARIEIAATLYQLFVADDNSSELFAQAKRIHSLFPYAVLKNIIRFSNPMTMMRAGIDLFLATPFGRASLFQRMFSSGLTEDIRQIEESIEELKVKINDADLCAKIKNFVNAREDQQAVIRILAADDEVDLLISILRIDDMRIEPTLNGQQISRVFTANVAWNAAIDGDTQYNTKDAQLYGYLSQLLKLYTRQRDKEQLMAILFDGATANLLKDIVAIFYEPLARVYKAASIHNSVMDFSRFFDDCVQTVNKAEDQDLSTNPNALVQTFIDLTGRHQNSFFHFVHEAHMHDNGLFEGLMSWVELILTFLRDGAAQEIDLDRIFETTLGLDQRKAINEIDACVSWNGRMKVWRQERLRKKMATQDTTSRDNTSGTIPLGTITGADFGLDQNDLDEMLYEDSDGDEELEEEIDELDPLEAELRRKKRNLAKLQRRYGEPEMPLVSEVYKMAGSFQSELRRVLAATA